MTATPQVDWKAVEDVATAQLVAAVRRVREEHPHEQVYGAVFHMFYGDGVVVSWPSVSVGTEESLAGLVADYVRQWGERPPLGTWDGMLRWSGADLPYLTDAGATEQGWAARVQEAASAAGEGAAWQEVYDRFLRRFPAAARRARTELVAADVVDEDFVAVAFDEDGELLALSLTQEQLRRHFPEHDDGG